MTSFLPLLKALLSEWSMIQQCDKQPSDYILNWWNNLHQTVCVFTDVHKLSILSASISLKQQIVQTSSGPHMSPINHQMELSVGIVLNAYWLSFRTVDSVVLQKENCHHYKYFVMLQMSQPALSQIIDGVHSDDVWRYAIFSTHDDFCSLIWISNSKQSVRVTIPFTIWF